MQVNAPSGTVVNTACAGDSLLATFVGQLELGMPIDEALKYAAATGASTAFSAGLSDLSDVKALMKALTVTDIMSS